MFVSFLPWKPEWFTAVQMLLTRFCQIFCAYAALSLAVIFPYPSERGVRALLRRANPIAFAIGLAMVYWGTISLVLLLRPLPTWYNPLGLTVTLAYFTAITIAFVVAGRGARGADAKRLKWVGYTLALGFSGSLIETLQFALRIPILPWEYWLGLTLLAIPLGLGYAIVRHRVVDIGFVVNRALVFGSLSVIVVAAFMVLEWTLSTVAMRISHLTSTSLELALALGLGFSMRSLHARVDRFVDDLFFRDRHEAERALRTLARDIAYVSDPQVAVARVQAEVAVRCGATGAAIYVADAARALRVDPGSGGPAPAVGIDDPALVRMRATRTFVELRRVDSALAGDFAFPMLVRDTVTGMLVLGSKSNGEAYAPDELATVETVTMALGNALDALQTAALRREVARVLHDGGIDGLRGMVEPARWARGTGTQPTGPLAGLGE
ncbi:hypothetical protein WPS_19520 [Vulcanimicrobium alpinum]|uniref:GAF domain-containing protein n=1 Tax=Vulcanimicrobium alpinum TaxID=3016050 RepID=A0AAN1XWH7_UNVUL|nr:hypothetical protein [Vulcanimicrobium alpinum]BDE06676.1 hypothetical protein WPS_19520 [Vulcanimicrobium alpinum]